MPEILPALLDCFEAWKADQDASQWDLTIHGKKQLLFAHFKGEGSKQLKALFMPKVLNLGHRMWRVGWEHRHNGSLQDPLKDLANGLIKLLDAGRLHDVLVVRQTNPGPIENAPRTVNTPAGPYTKNRRTPKPKATQSKSKPRQGPADVTRRSLLNVGTSALQAQDGPSDYAGEDYFAFEGAQARDGLGYTSYGGGSYCYEEPLDWTVCDKDCGWCGRCEWDA
ncbi:hypothetical protein FRB96_000111 [Tulasnella sp. 330]|nr:hypothetical protein FRB96_000111 [Tulasnella sp. 330]KAG8891012.1 hypothetical protein FRB98_000021 [Tulasnella sp. 332]